MPNEINSGNPTSDTQVKPSIKGDALSPTQQGQEMREESNGGSAGEETVSVQLERDIRTGEKILIVINSLLLITTVVIAAIYWGQLQEMKAAVNQSERQAILGIGQLAITNRNMTLSENNSRSAIKQSDLDQRAWVGSVTSRIDQFDMNNPFVATVELSNSGKTPAVHLRAAHSYVPIDEPRPYAFTPSVTGPPIGLVKDMEKHLIGDRVIAPQAKIEIVADSRLNHPANERYPPLTALINSKYQQFVEGGSHLFIFGEVRYDDVVGGKRHTTKWCYYVRNSSGKGEPPKWTLNTCERFNSMD